MQWPSPSLSSSDCCAFSCLISCIRFHCKHRCSLPAHSMLIVSSSRFEIFRVSLCFAMKLLTFAAAVALFHCGLSCAAPTEERCGPEHSGRKCTNDRCCSHAGFCVSPLPSPRICRPESELTFPVMLTDAGSEIGLLQCALEVLTGVWTVRLRYSSSWPFHCKG